MPRSQIVKLAFTVRYRTLDLFDVYTRDINIAFHKHGVILDI